MTRPILSNYVHRYEGVETEFVGHYYGRVRFWRISFPPQVIGDTRYVDFEDTKLPVFEDVEGYLVNRFGDQWMEMPSRETRDQYPSHGGFVDLEKDYTEYMSEKGDKWLYE